ncbi:MAG: DMT family transporter [Bacteroidales bacterium]|nr:DMT family transporter [Bacteroidales bacterium]
MKWIWFSIIASLFFSLRYVIIKKYLSNVDTYLMAFAYRFFGFLFLIPLLLFFNFTFISSSLFWTITIITAFFTAIASIMQLTAIQKYELSSSVPFIAFIPLIMILPVYIFFNELPTIYTLPGIFLLSLGGIIIQGKAKQHYKAYLQNLIKNKGSLLFFGVAVIFGITTTLDRIAISEAHNSGFIYTFIWHFVSMIIFSFIFLNKKKLPRYYYELKSNVVSFAIQGFLGIAAFLLQMLAVESAHQVKANVIYVKALTLIYLFLSVLFGILFFKEKHAIFKIIGALIMIGGAILIILNV